MPRYALLAAVALLPAGCGKKPFRTFTAPDGSFSILMPGSPSRTEESDRGLRMVAFSVDRWGEGHSVGYADIPPGTPWNLDGAVGGIADRAGGRVARSAGGNTAAAGWREFEIEGGRAKFVSGRVLVARGRLYVFLAGGPDARLENPEVRAFLESFRLTDGDTPGPATMPLHPPPAPDPARPGGTPPRFQLPDFALDGLVPPPGPEPVPPAVAVAPPAPKPPPKPKPPAVLGGALSDAEFRDTAPAGGLLVGFDVGLVTFINYDVIGTVRPIFRVGGKDEVGRQHGTDTRRHRRFLAKPGYAVGAIDVKAGLGVDGFRLTFMKVVGDRLDPADAYQTEWVGGPGGHLDGRHGGDGTPVVGIVGKENTQNLSGIGLVLKGAE